MLVLQLLASVHAEPVLEAQVFVTGLQMAMVQAAVANASVQTPVCSAPSLGNADPGAPLLTHEKLERSQYCELPQSLSMKQPPALGTHAPEALQAPD